MNHRINEHDTLPIPIVLILQADQALREEREFMPTIREVRERCQLSYFQLAMAARVRPRVVYWMEQGISVWPSEALRILDVLSRQSGQHYTLMNVRDIRLKRVKMWR